MTLEKIKDIIAVQFSVNKETLSEETSFRGDLNADSIDLVELAMSVEDEFNLPEPENDEFPPTETIGELVEYINSIINA